MVRGMNLAPIACACVAALLLPWTAAGESAPPQARSVAAPELFARANLAAWCIVPFDEKKRGPEERAAMLERIGLRRFAYDYRAEHVPTFDAELEALKRHGIELTAWWFPATLNDEARHILDVIRRHGVHPQLWVTGSGETPRTPAEQAARVETEAARLRPIAQEAAKLGCQVALYNHGGWFGEPETQLAILDRLARDGIANAGLVYNLHHAHSNLDRLAVVLEKIRPHLLALNLNGMTRGGDQTGDKILPLGQGEFDLEVLRAVLDNLNGWRGPVGILNHTGADAEARLLDNLDGLDWLLPQLTGQPAGPKPQPRSWKAPAAKAADAGTSVSAEFGPALRGGLVVDGKPEFRAPPLTVECWVKLESASHYNILVASDTKQSGAHWELFTTPVSGWLTAYLPGLSPDHVRSKAALADGAWHHVAMVWEPARVRLFVDGTPVAEQPVVAKNTPPLPGGLAFGRLVEGNLGCDGLVDDVRLSRGTREVKRPAAPLAREPDTLGLWDFNRIQTAPPPPAPAPFLCNRRPLHPEDWPLWEAAVNRDRMFDYYAKEARHFRAQRPLPALLPAYPGLDSGVFGHWGNQNEETWRDGRWNESNFGPMVSGVFRGAGLVVPKAVCVRLGMQGELAACFDTELLDFRVVWKGGFVSVDDYRHGFLNGIQLQGDLVAKFPPAPPPAAGSVWRGLYRHGERVVFSYTRDGAAIFDSAWAENGRFVRQRTPAADSPKEWTAGGPARWPQVLETRGQPGQGTPFAVDTLTLPLANPWKALWFVGDHDFYPNGDLAVCTFSGDVWRVSGVDESLAHLRWRRIASGLHQPLGLVVVDGDPCVLGRDQITRLRDLNGDGEADFYECVTNGYTTSRSGHDYVCGLQRDAQGRFYFASSVDGVCRVAPGGKAKVLATGFRNPDGLGLAPDGTVTTSVQEGDWTPASAVCQIKPGGFYGYRGPKPGVATEPPLVYLPRGLDNSSGGQVFVDSDRWGTLLKGQLLHFSFGAAAYFLVLRETIAGQTQGAAVPLPGSFLSGSHRGRFSPRDGQLYVSGMNGWGTYTEADGCLQRVRFNGGPAQLPTGIHTHDNGVLLTFAEPLDRDVAGDPARHFAQCWNYRYSAAYGSPEFSLRFPGTPGHDPLAIASAHVTADGRGLFLEIPELQPANQIHLHVASAAGREHDVFLTAHRLGAPYTSFPGYRPAAKTKPAPDHCQVPASPFAPAEPNRWATGTPGRPIRIEAANGMKFSTTALRAQPGERISLTFANPDVMPHNWSLLATGSLERVGELVNKFVADPRAVGRQYVPETPEVLAYTDIVMPGASFTIHFNAPSQPGDYPYICTFPGHWQVMNGVLHVAPEKP